MQEKLKVDDTKHYVAFLIRINYINSFKYLIEEFEAFGNRQLPKALLTRIREMLVKLSKIKGTRSKSTHNLLRTAIGAKMIDTMLVIRL